MREQFLQLEFFLDVILEDFHGLLIKREIEFFMGRGNVGTRGLGYSVTN